MVEICGTVYHTYLFRLPANKYFYPDFHCYFKTVFYFRYRTPVFILDIANYHTFGIELRRVWFRNALDGDDTQGKSETMKRRQDRIVCG